MRTTLFAAVAALALVAAAAPVAAIGAPATAVSKPADNARIGHVLTRAHLVGVWGTDCANINSTSWESIVADERGVYQSIEGGDDFVSTYDIVSASRLNSRDIRMEMVLVPEDPSDAEEGDHGGGGFERITVVYRIEGDKQMTWSSVAANGDKLITDGVFAGGEGEDAQRSEWYHFCPNGRPVPSADAESNVAPAATDDGSMPEDVHKAPK